MESHPDPDERGGWTRGRAIGVSVGVALAAGIVALLIAGLVNRDQDLQIDREIEAGRAPAAPRLELPVLVSGGGLPPAGERTSVEALRGRPVVVNLWASWCEPCESEAPILQRVWERYRERGVVVLGIDVQDRSDDAKAFIAEQRLTYPSLRDGTEDTQKDLEATGVPETFVIDRAGRIRLSYRGEITVASEREITGFLDTELGR